MKKSKLIAVSVPLLTSMFVMSMAPVQEQTRQKSAQIMVLGSYHMANPGADVFNLQADDVLAPKRQAEMQELVNKLAKFKPTKIVVEVDSNYDSIFNVRYRNYVKGGYALKQNESEQIGFRLAKQLGHTNIHCVDEPGKFDFNSVMQFGMANGMGQDLQTMMGMVQEHIKAENTRLAQSTIGAFLKEMNRPEVHLQGLDWYMKLLNISKKGEFPGPELVTDVYERNLKIMSNIFRLKENEQERILVIYGNGHSSFFKSILLGSQEFEWIDVYEYL
jgi:hypothetical protein